MGKVKPRHKNNRKHNKSHPTGLPSVKDTESEESQLNSCKNELVIQNIVQEIQSSNIEDKLCGLQSLVTLAENVDCVDTILRYKIIKIIAPFLIDQNSEVRNFTAGFLRNLSATGSVEVCERLVKDDIMTPLVALLQQFSDWKPETSKSVNTDTLLQVVNILWNLCEVDETALKYFNSANLLEILLRCLDYKTVGLDLSISVCQCLNSVSEDNAIVISALRSRESDFHNLLTVESTDNKLLLLKTLTAGIMVNINPSIVWLPSVLAVVHDVLKVDVRGLASQLSSELPLDTTTPLSAEAQTLLDNTQALIDAQALALEILTNLTSSQDDEMDVESEGSTSDDEGKPNGWTEADTTQTLALSIEILEGLEKYKLVLAVFSKIESLPENVIDIFNTCSYTSSLAKRAVRLQCRAFLCFNNLVSVLDIELLGGPYHLCSLVRQISNQRLCLNLQQLGTDFNIELLEASTAAIRAILLRLVSIKFSHLGDVHTSDMEVFFNIGLSSEPQVQANVIRIIGTLGILLVNTNAFMVKMAGNYLLEAAEKQLALWLTAEALDSLMDIFGEDSTDQVSAEINLVPRLQALAPRLKYKMKQERRTLGEHYPVVSTVMTNLTPFIKYKAARVAALRQS